VWSIGGRTLTADSRTPERERPSRCLCVPHKSDTYGLDTILHNTELYCTTLHYIAQYCTILHHIALYCTILHYIAPHYTVSVSAGNSVLPVAVLTADATNEYHIHTGLEMNPGPRGARSLTTLANTNPDNQYHSHLTPANTHHERQLLSQPVGRTDGQLYL
jgi:hypothetical protein